MLVAALACGEAITPSAPVAPASPTVLHARIGCVANARAAEVRCVYVDSAAQSRLHAGSTVRDLVVGGQNTYVTLASSNVSYSGEVFSFNTTVQNLLGQPLGTSDGTTLDPSGVRVFFYEAPVVTTGTGTIDFADPVGGASMVDGVGSFTTSNQPYYQYDEIIAPGQTSSAKTWRIHVPATVSEFEFAVYVSAEIPSPVGYIDVTPATSSLRIGATQQLTATLRDAVGHADANEKVTWSTSDATIATVDAGTGLVTAVAGGTATITATTATRTGSANIGVGGTVTQFAVTAVGGGTIGQQVAGTPFTVQVTALDANGDTALFNGSATLTSTGALTGTPITTAPFTNGALASQSVTITNTGSFTLTATNTTPAATGTSASFTVVAGAAAHIAKVAGGGQSAQVGTAVATAPQVLVTDANNNPVAGVPVTFAVASGGGAVTSATQSTDANGLAAVGSWTLGTVSGTNTLNVAVNSISATFSATGTPGPVASFVVEKAAGGSIGNQISGARFAIKISARDAFNNIATSFTGKVILTSNGTLNGAPLTSSAFAAGVLSNQSVNISSTGITTITATKSPSGPQTGTSAPFTVKPI
ncbi:MAG TPA: Ig-like domain-containing protein [Gemmatimonadaceae bacterium]